MRTPENEPAPVREDQGGEQNQASTSYQRSGAPVKCSACGGHGTRLRTMTRTLRYGKGYTGKSGNKCWVARITGTDKTYGLQRDFLEPTEIKREHFNRARTMIDFSYELTVDGLYELSEDGERWFEMCFAAKDGGEIKTSKISDARLKAWVVALDEGKTDREARLASKGL
jgi:hypothetical protein